MKGRGFFVALGWVAGLLSGLQTSPTWRQSLPMAALQVYLVAFKRAVYLRLCVFASLPFNLEPFDVYRSGERRRLAPRRSE